MWCFITHYVVSKVNKFPTNHPRQTSTLPVYPYELEEQIMWHEQAIVLRPIKPEDSDEHQRFFTALAPVDIHSRLFYSMRELPPAQLSKLTHIDYDGEMAFVAIRKRTDGSDETLGVARGIADTENKTAEFAIIIRSDVKGQGLGYLLMNKLIAYFRQRGTSVMIGEMLSDNTAMHELVNHLGFVLHAKPEEGIMTLQLKL
jgi:acetyl-CoA synthetase (ADP-forming)/acetyltransferase